MPNTFDDNAVGRIASAVRWVEANAQRLAAIPVQRRRRRGGGGGGSGNAQVISVKNNSGSDCEKYQILGIDDMVITPTVDLASFQSNPTVSGVTPTTADHYGKFVILSQAISSGNTGKGWIMGAVLVQIDITDADHKYADVKNSDLTELESKVNGCAGILWRETGTGTKWALVRLGGLTETGGCS